MTPPERFPPSSPDRAPTPRRIDWRDLLAQAPSASPPADFAARMQAAVEREAHVPRGEALTMQVLLLILVAAGTAFALPGLGSGFAALLQQMGDAVSGVLALGSAVAAAWLIDLAARRPRLLLDG